MIRSCSTIAKSHAVCRQETMQAEYFVMRLKALLPNVAGVFLMVGLSLGTAQDAAADTLKLIVQRGYLPGVPALVRVEVLTPAGVRNTSLWDGEALLSTDAGVTLSTNRVPMRNGVMTKAVRRRAPTACDRTADD